MTSAASVMDQMVIDQLRDLGSDMDQPRDTRHYLYFRKRHVADEVGRGLSERGYKIEVAPGATDEETWLVLASHDLVVTIDSISLIRSSLEKLAAEHGGEYDGWEAAAG